MWHVGKHQCHKTFKDETVCVLMTTDRRALAEISEILIIVSVLFCDFVFYLILGS